MRSEEASGGVAYSLVVTPAAGTEPGSRFDSATVAATVMSSDFARAPAGAYMDTIELALRHAVSGQALASTRLALRLHADPAHAR